MDFFLLFLYSYFTWKPKGCCWLAAECYCPAGRYYYFSLTIQFLHLLIIESANYRSLTSHTCCLSCVQWEIEKKANKFSPAIYGSQLWQ
jgi:hypothetical protein